MNLYDLFIKPYEGYENYQIILEAIGTIFGLLSVFFSMRKNILVYPTGIISTTIYIYLCFIAGLYGDTLISLYYTIMSIYGWILWAKSSEDQIHIEVSKTSKQEWQKVVYLFGLSVGMVGLVYYFKPIIDNQFSMQNVTLGFHKIDFTNYLDILTTAIFLVGMWLMAKRKIENWLFWIVGDLISVPLYAYKGLGITSIQYFIFTFLAIRGYMEWKKTKYQQHS